MLVKDAEEMKEMGINLSHPLQVYKMLFEYIS